LTSTVNNISPILTEVDIIVPAEEIEKSANRVYANLSKDAKIRGFRKGKVPRSVLRRMFSAAVLNEIKGDILSRFFVMSMMEHKINPVSEPDFDAGDIVEGEEYNFKVKVEVVPKLDKINYDAIEINRHKVAVPDVMIDAEIKRMRDSLAVTEDLETSRPAQMGDLVVLNMKRFENDEWVSGGMPPQQFVLEENMAPEEIIAEIVGMNEDDEKVIEFGPKREDETRLSFKCTLNSIMKRELPKVDDEFAKDLGDFETLQELRDDIEQRLLKNLNKQEDDRLKQELFEKLRAKNDIELPPALVSKQAQMMKKQFADMMQNMGGDSDDDSEESKKRDESTDKAALGIVHQYFLNMEIARIEKIEVTDEDVDAEFADISEQKGMPVPKLRAEYQKAELIPELKNTILERKVFDFVLSRVKITEIDPPVEEAVGEES